MFFASAHKMVKNAYAVSFQKELFLTNNSIPISLKVHIMISILDNKDYPFCFASYATST